jgi:hypothetical protein
MGLLAAKCGANTCYWRLGAPTSPHPEITGEACAKPEARRRAEKLNA